MNNFSKPDSFLDIDEELSWYFFRENGNPYVMEDIINKRYPSKEESLGLGRRWFYDWKNPSNRNKVNRQKGEG